MTNGLFTWSKLQNVLQNMQLQKFCKIFANFLHILLQQLFVKFLQMFCKLIWNLDIRYLFLLLIFFSTRGCRMRHWWPLVPFFFWRKCFKYFAKNFVKNVQNFCKMSKNNFLLCKNFAKFLQILNLHTDFRPCEESVSSRLVYRIVQSFFKTTLFELL